jgi:hypothetical protein
MTPRSEQELLDATVDLAMHCRWAVCHFRPARTRTGFRTAIQGHAGFPDLVLARNGVVLFRELKGYDSRGRLGKVTPEQRDWAKQIAPGWTPGGAEMPRQVPLFDVWTPDDWPLILATLTAPAWVTT